MYLFDLFAFEKQELLVKHVVHFFDGYQGANTVQFGMNGHVAL